MGNTDVRFGLSLWLDNPVQEVVDVAVAAEDAGFDDVWMPDHYFLRDVYIALAMTARATSRIRLGAAVAAVQLRHPALLASATATVDELSGGRAVLGLGPGGHEFAAHFDMRPKSPLTLVREGIEIARGLFSGRSDLEGAGYTTRNASLGWKTRSDIPIVMAARGPKMIELAGEVADGVLIHGNTGPFISHVKELVARGAERAGRPADACRIGIITDIEVDEDENAAIERTRPRMTIIAGGSYSDDSIPLYGLDPDDVGRLRKALQSQAPDVASYVTPEMVRAFGLVGTKESIAEQIHELHAYGIEEIMFLSPGLSCAQSLERIPGYRDVIAAVKA